MKNRRTVTMFVVDTSSSMKGMKSFFHGLGEYGDEKYEDKTHLEWGVRYVKTQIQKMTPNGDDTDLCGVIVYGCPVTDNVVNKATGDYLHVVEFSPVAAPCQSLLSKLDRLEPSRSTVGDPFDALIVAIETQTLALASKRAGTWTRKIVLVTNCNSQFNHNDWEVVTDKMNEEKIKFVVVGVTSDDPDWRCGDGLKKDARSRLEETNERLFADMARRMEANSGISSTLSNAFREAVQPHIERTQSALSAATLRIEGPKEDPDAGIEIAVRTSKATSIRRPPTWSKFVRRSIPAGQGETVVRKRDRKDEFARVKMRTQYNYEVGGAEGDEENQDAKKPTDEPKETQEVHKKELILGLRFGLTFVPCDSDDFETLPTKKGISICGFFPAENFRREQAMGEIYYIWGDPGNRTQPGSPKAQVAVSSFARAMEETGKMAIARWVSRDGADPKMVVLKPRLEENVDCLLWVQMPFMEDVRDYALPSLGQPQQSATAGEAAVKEHSSIPTKEQCEAMGAFVDAMDLMDAGPHDKSGKHGQWFNPSQSLNPAVHRMKQAMLHSGVVDDVGYSPVPPPHPDLTKFFEPPSRAIERSKKPLEDCKRLFRVKQMPKRTPKAKEFRDRRLYTYDDECMELLLLRKGPDSESETEPETEDESEESLLPGPKRKNPAPK